MMLGDLAVVEFPRSGPHVILGPSEYYLTSILRVARALGCYQLASAGRHCDSCVQMPRDINLHRPPGLGNIC